MTAVNVIRPSSQPPVTSDPLKLGSSSQMTRHRYSRTPENPLRGPCQGPDKILTFGLDVCADPDNFRAQNPCMYVSQSRQFWPSRGGLCQSPDNFGRGPGQAGHIDMAYRMPPDASIQFLRSL
jgi:hypothetical protein